MCGFWTVHMLLAASCACTDSLAPVDSPLDGLHLAQHGQQQRGFPTTHLAHDHRQLTCEQRLNKKMYHLPSCFSHPTECRRSATCGDADVDVGQRGQVASPCEESVGHLDTINQTSQFVASKRCGRAARLLSRWASTPLNDRINKSRINSVAPSVCEVSGGGRGGCRTTAAPTDRTFPGNTERRARPRS